MSKAVSSGQARGLIGSFTLDTPWDSIELQNPRAVQAFLELPPLERGRLWAEFVANGCQSITHVDPKTLRINLKKMFNPTDFIGEGWTIWRGPKDGDGFRGVQEIDARSLALISINITDLILETCLKQGETTITGEEKLKRLESLKDTIRLDGNVFIALWEDYQTNRENSCLEWIRKNRGVTYLDFLGLVLRSPAGSRSILYLYFDGNRWDWNNYWLVNNWNQRPVSACLASNAT